MPDWPPIRFYRKYPDQIPWPHNSTRKSQGDYRESMLYVPADSVTASTQQGGDADASLGRDDHRSAKSAVVAGAGIGDGLGPEERKRAEEEVAALTSPEGVTELLDRLVQAIAPVVEDGGSDEQIQALDEVFADLCFVAHYRSTQQPVQEAAPDELLHELAEASTWLLSRFEASLRGEVVREADHAIERVKSLVGKVEGLADCKQDSGEADGDRCCLATCDEPAVLWIASDGALCAKHRDAFERFLNEPVQQPHYKSGEGERG